MVCSLLRTWRYFYQGCGNHREYKEDILSLVIFSTLPHKLPEQEDLQLWVYCVRIFWSFLPSFLPYSLCCDRHHNSLLTQSWLDSELLQQEENHQKHQQLIIGLYTNNAKCDKVYCELANHRRPITFMNIIRSVSDMLSGAKWSEIALKPLTWKPLHYYQLFTLTWGQCMVLQPWIEDNFTVLKIPFSIGF